MSEVVYRSHVWIERVKGIVEHIRPRNRNPRFSMSTARSPSVYKGGSTHGFRTLGQGFLGGVGSSGIARERC